MPSITADLTGTINLTSWGPLPELHPVLSAIAPPSVSFGYDDGKIQTSITLYNPGMEEDTAQFWTTDLDGICNTAEDTFGEEDGPTPWEDLGEVEFGQIVKWGNDVHRRIESAVLSAAEKAVQHGTEAYDAVLAFALNTTIPDDERTPKEMALFRASEALSVTGGITGSDQGDLQILMVDFLHHAEENGLDLHAALKYANGIFQLERNDAAFSAGI